jgi:hypothetical protein
MLTSRPKLQLKKIPLLRSKGTTSTTGNIAEQKKKIPLIPKKVGSKNNKEVSENNMNIMNNEIMTTVNNEANPVDNNELGTEDNMKKVIPENDEETITIVDPENDTEVIRKKEYNSSESDEEMIASEIASLKKDISKLENENETLLAVPGNMKKTEVVPENMKETEVVPENNKEAVVIPENMEEPEVVLENNKETVVVPENMKESKVNKVDIINSNPSPQAIHASIPPITNKAKLTLKKKAPSSSDETNETPNSFKPKSHLVSNYTNTSTDQVVSLDNMQKKKLGAYYYWFSKDGNIYDFNAELIGKVRPNNKVLWIN